MSETNPLTQNEETLLMEWGDHCPTREARYLIAEKQTEAIQRYMTCHECGHEKSEADIREMMDKDPDRLEEKLSEAISGDSFFWEDKYEQDREFLEQLLNEREAPRGWLVHNRHNEPSVWDPDAGIIDDKVASLFHFLFFKHDLKVSPDTLYIRGYRITKEHPTLADDERGLTIDTLGYDHWTLEPLTALTAALYDAIADEEETGTAEWDTTGELYIEGEVIGCAWPLKQAYSNDPSNPMIYVHDDHRQCQGQPEMAVSFDPGQAHLYDFGPGIYPLFNNAEQLIRYHFTGKIDGDIVTRTL